MATGLTAAVWAGYAVSSWLRYGRPRPGEPEEHDALLDRCMPVYDVVERHHVRVRAPAATTLAAARSLALEDQPLVNAIFKARELLMGGQPADRSLPHGLVDQVRALGWGELAEVPGSEIVMGAVTKPWQANPAFRAVSPERFAAFDESDYVKIAWTLRADPVGPAESIFRTETRAIATDRRARAKFRVYWACLSPGILLIRRAMLRPVKREAERRAASGRHLPRPDALAGPEGMPVP